MRVCPNRPQRQQHRRRQKLSFGMKSRSNVRRCENLSLLAWLIRIRNLIAITRTMTSMYLLPLLVLQATSQLTLLSRLHLLRTLAAEHHGISPERDEGDDDDVSNISASMSPTSTTFGRLMKAKEAIVRPWSYFSLQEMGLQDIAQEDEQAGQGGIAGFVGSVWTELSSGILGSSASTAGPAAPESPQEPLHARLDSETERLFLCMSWWFLHIGWRILEGEAAKAVTETCQR